MVQELERGGTVQAIIIAVFLALLETGMAIYLNSLRHPAIQITNYQEAPMPQTTANGIIRKSSNHSVHQTVDKLKNILQSKGVTLFALVDHSGEAEKTGLQMPPTKLLVFGNPQAGTPLMVAAPSSAIDLPLKILVAEDSQGKVWVSYNTAEYIGHRHGLPSDLLPNIAIVETLAATAAE